MVFGITSTFEWVLLLTKINFYKINHLDFGIILDSGMPFAADQLVFQNLGFIAFSKGSPINNHMVKILGIFDLPPPSWSLLLNKAYVIKWSFG